MASVTEYLERLQKLTQTNCEILQAINDSFFTKNNHLTASIGDKQYIIPSFLSLENKINSLRENFNNLVYAPKTGEATFNFDGASQTIELKGFNCTPNSISLESPKEFNVEKNQIFKDFLTPSVFINFNINSIPNDINKVVIKKIVAISNIMKSEFSSYLTNHEDDHNTSISISYEDLYKKGPDNRPEFRVAVTLNGSRLAEGVGGSKKQAQAKAAKKALESLIQRSKSKGGKNK
jgi:hypothetical protein